MPLAGTPSAKHQIGLPFASEGLPPQRRGVSQKSLFLQYLRAVRRDDANPFCGL